MIAQVLILCLFSLAHGGLPYQAPLYGSPYAVSIDEKPQPYSFNVDVKDEYGTVLTRQEVGDDLGNKKGSYGYIDANGIARQVDYVADGQGFRAIVKTNEPGTDNQNPADVEIISNPVQVPSSYKNPSIPAYAQSVPSYGVPAAIVSTGSINRQPLRQVAVPGALKVAPGIYNAVPGALNVAPGVYNAAPNQPLGVLKRNSLY